MMNLGQVLVLVTTAATATAVLAYLPGVQRGMGRPLLRVARPAVYLTALGLAACTAYLWYLLLNSQYQYDYVYR